jgi:hypothetical protein
MAFETVDPSGVPRWQHIMPLFERREYGDVITYEDLEQALDGASRLIVQNVVRAMSKRLLRDHQKAIQAVMNQGYRIIEPKEHLSASQDRKERARRQATQALDLVTYVDRTALDMEEQKRVERTEVAAAALLQWMRWTTEKIIAQERLFAGLDARISKLENGGKKE